jgi:membrane-associated protease RseP (regulator of RpoE activity)
MEFIYIDIILLVLFSIFVAIFLIKNRKKLQVESKIFLLYRTKVGIKFIKWVTKTLSPVMPVLVWVSISTGFVLMIAMIFLLIQSVIMLIQMQMVISAPPIMPILPYVPQALDLPFPDFYFIHWIVAIVLLATTHEAAHGVFASFFKIRIKATGFGFLGPFLAAFVEPDEKVMKKRNAKQQLSILAAGSFSNLSFAIIFMLLLQVFFVFAYTPAGVGNYIFIYKTINITEIDSIGPYSLDGFLNLSDEEMSEIQETLIVRTKNEEYYLNSMLLEEISQNRNLIENTGIIIAFEDTPAFQANLSGGIQEINGVEIKNLEDFTNELSKYNSGDQITIVTSENTYNIVLAQHPSEPQRGYLGVGFPQMSAISALSFPYFNPYLHVEPNMNRDTLVFIQDFFIWMILIFFLVALFNMLPLGFLDGGRYIYVLAFTLTKSEKAAARVFRIFSSFILLIFFVMMLIWVIRINM